MAKRASKRSRGISKLLKLQEAARARYVYFISTDVEGATGYWWELVGPDDNPIASGPVFHNKADCLKSLRTMQRHAATAPIRDDAR